MPLSGRLYLPVRPCFLLAERLRYSDLLKRPEEFAGIP